MPPEAEDPVQPDEGPPQESAVDVNDAGNGAGEDDRPRARPEEADDEDDDEDDYQALPFKEDPQFKKVLAKLKKRNRQLQRLRPLAARVKDVDLDSVLTKAKSADELQATLSRHPELAEQVLKAMAGLMDDRKSDAKATKFDRKSLPFNVDDESGQFFATFYEEFLAMKEELASTKSELATHRDASARHSRASEMRSWQEAVKAAASKVPEWSRDMFNDAVYGAYREAQGRGTRLDPQRVIRHYLSKLPIGDKAKAAANAAAKDRIASSNDRLPRVPSRSGVPASVRKPGETVADVNRRIRSGAYSR